MKQFISNSAIITAVNTIIKKYENEISDVDFVVGMSRGGLIPAVMIATRLDKPLVTVYIDKKDNIYLDREDWLKGKNVLFVDDICRSGLTLKLATEFIMKTSNPKKISRLTLFNITDYSTKKKVDQPEFSKQVIHDVILPWDYDRKKVR